IARSIAQAHAGAIGATSRDGLTEVFLDLPHPRARAPNTANDAPPLAASTAPTLAQPQLWPKRH
ncbi:MAG: hypothetical protein H7125_11030, partial [Proteobacteria bacterium]|nr:hypothetical protein [Burkholderiales bacterium]